MPAESDITFKSKPIDAVNGHIKLQDAFAHVTCRQSSNRQEMSPGDQGPFIAGSLFHFLLRRLHVFEHLLTLDMQTNLSVVAQTSAQN